MRLTKKMFKHLIKPYQATFQSELQNKYLLYLNGEYSFYSRTDIFADKTRTLEEVLYYIIEAFTAKLFIDAYKKKRIKDCF